MRKSQKANVANKSRVSRVVNWAGHTDLEGPGQHMALQTGWSESRSAVSDSLRPLGLYSAWNSPGQNTGMGSFSLLHGIFPTLGSNPGFSHYRWILYQLSHKGSPRILEWVAYPFSSGFSRPKESNQRLLHCRLILYQLSYQGSPADQVRSWNFNFHHNGKPMESSEQSTDIIWVNILK